MNTVKRVNNACVKFFNACRINDSYAFRPFIESPDKTLYSSVFAVMAYHYAGELENFSPAQKAQWAQYILAFQSTDDGLFDSEELHGGLGEHHNLEHRKLHLTCHVLPALALLNTLPLHPISYVENYLDKDRFAKWLDARDLSMAWVEGNNLFFAGQLLIHEIETSNRGHEALDQLFSWLEKTIDPKTALWGTDHGCSLHKAMYGAYHQLILYFYKNRSVPHIEKLIDSVLACQHFDGGFSEWRGGGTCQDIDGIDILVNCYRLTNYRERDVRRSLRRSLRHILDDRLIAASGFQDRAGHEFIHNSMTITRTPKGVANTFSTWFTLHALVDIGSVLHRDTFFNESSFHFNSSCSMGWGVTTTGLRNYNKIEAYWDAVVFLGNRMIVKIYDLIRR